MKTISNAIIYAFYTCFLTNRWMNYSLLLRQRLHYPNKIFFKKVFYNENGGKRDIKQII